MSDLDVVLATVIQCVQEDAAKHQHGNNYYPAAFHVQKSAKFLHWTHFVELAWAGQSHGLPTKRGPQ